MRRRHRRPTFTAATLAALFAATACTTTVATPPEPRPVDTSRPTPTGSYPQCETFRDGTTSCVVDGRPLRRRRRRHRGLLLPLGDGSGDSDARIEYASVASFAELALRLMAVGAPVELVEACHRAALDEIRHSRQADALAQRDRVRFGAIPELLGRRIGGRARTRRAQLRRIAVESFVDGWLNEGAAAAALRRRSEVATGEDRATLLAMAADEEAHALLARDIVEWCFDEEPRVVGSALAALAG